MVDDVSLSLTASWPTINSQQESLQCPRCKNRIAIERVSRGAVVRSVLFFLPLRAYKCQRCRRKFHRLGRTQKLG